MKKCKKCKKLKSESEFGFRSNTKDNLCERCRPCMRSYSFLYNYRQKTSGMGSLQNTYSLIDERKEHQFDIYREDE